MAQRRVISRNWFEKEISKQLKQKDFSTEPYNFLLQFTKAIMSTNNSREILA